MLKQIRNSPSGLCVVNLGLGNGKVNLFLCLIKYQAINTYGGVEAQLHHS
jgi:hypothetical protein